MQNNVSEKFIGRIIALNNRAEAANKTLQDLGAIAIKKAFSGKDTTYAQALLDTLIPVYRMPMKQWLGKLGLEVSALDKEHKGQFVVVGVRNQKDQNKVFKRIAAGDLPDVIALADKIATTKKETVLKGTPQERADQRMAKVIESMREKDAAAAAYLQDKWSAKAADLHNVMYTNDGDRVELSATEYNELMGLLAAIRSQALTLKVAA